jgi:hypothetical protein
MVILLSLVKWANARTVGDRARKPRTSYDDIFSALRNVRNVDACYVYRASTALFMRVLGTPSRAGDERARDQRTCKLTTRRDPELREHSVQVRADRAMREVQSLADLAVG